MKKIMNMSRNNRIIVLDIILLLKGRSVKMLYIEKGIGWLVENRDWIFSGIGLTVIGVTFTVLRKIFCKKKIEPIEDKQHVQSSKENIAGNGNINGNRNILGSGNISAGVVNIYGIDNEKKECQVTESWFEKRFNIMLELLNDARDFREKEYTIEYVSSLIGLESVEELKCYLNNGIEPDDNFKQKFIEAFGVNKEWMLYGQGECPFLSNVKIFGNNPMDILREENLMDIEKFVIVIGEYEQRRYACIIKKKSEFCYEIYPKRYILNSDVGNSGKTKLIEFYRFVRESDKIKKLDFNVYEATEQQFIDLYNGSIAPKKVQKFKVARDFVDDFLDLSSDSIERNSRFWDEDFQKVQNFIKEGLEEQDRIDSENDKRLITENLGNILGEKYDDIDSFDSSTSFFDYRFGKAFPGVRGMKEFNEPQECVNRLEILLRSPLKKEGLTSPIWWFRGGANLHIDKFVRLSKTKFLMNCNEIEINRIVIYASSEYYKKFVYVEAKPEKATGLYQEISEEDIAEHIRRYGEYHEEYAVYNGKNVTRAEYDDGAAVIDGKVVDMGNEAKLRIRYLTPYNFIICAQFNPINETKNDSIMKMFMDGILQGTYSINDIVKFVDGLYRHKRDV